MISKIKYWIRRKLRQFLDIEQLQKDIIKLDLKLDELSWEVDGNYIAQNNDNTRLNSRLDCLREENEKVLKTSKSLLQQFNLSVDVRPYENLSWAVISIQGKPDYVKFVNLSYKDMMSINSFIRQFEHINKIIDTPQPWMFE